MSLCLYLSICLSDPSVIHLPLKATAIVHAKTSEKHRLSHKQKPLLWTWVREPGFTT